MFDVERIPENPFLLPDHDQSWQSYSAFNPCVAEHDGQYHLLYRAMSAPRSWHGANLSVSSIGYSCSDDPRRFTDTRQLIEPEEDWERYGCEDPRVTYLDGTYYIFYTAISAYPFQAQDIRIGVATTRDFQSIDEKHLVTPFNAKAMALFPEKINGKLAAILTVDTDEPPAKICLAWFDDESQIWSERYWEKWHSELPGHVIPLLRSSGDHLEVGAPPVKTKDGWLLIYSYIRNYFSPARHFGVEAVLLDADDPSRVIARTNQPILMPEMQYEHQGVVENVIFPSGALIKDNQLYIYYGAADTTCCLAIANIDELLDSLKQEKKTEFVRSEKLPNGFLRYSGNPIIRPRPELTWEAQSTFNPAAIYEDGRFHLLYRAMSCSGTSVIGYASSKDGITIDERPELPVYVPRESFEQELRPGFSGCEDPRLTRLDDHFYMFYTAFDGYTPRVAFSSISVKDFIANNWDWDTPQVITPPGVDDKDACLLPEKIDGKFVIFHRPGNDMCLNYVDSLEFGKGNWLERSEHILKPQNEKPNTKKYGLSVTPIKTPRGWLMFYHRVAAPGSVYTVEALMLELDNPSRVIGETDSTLLAPEMDYEKIGDVHNVVFPCGAVLHDDEVFMYYGGGDKVIGVAKMKLDAIYQRLGVTES